jgi:hypothetical protein
MCILEYIMISTNRIFESAHGPEIPNFLEIVAGLYSIGLPRRLIISKLYTKNKRFWFRNTSVISIRNISRSGVSSFLLFIRVNKVNRSSMSPRYYGKSV